MVAYAAQDCKISRARRMNRYKVRGRVGRCGGRRGKPTHVESSKRSWNVCVEDIRLQRRTGGGYTLGTRLGLFLT